MSDQSYAAERLRGFAHEVLRPFGGSSYDQ